MSSSFYCPGTEFNSISVDDLVSRCNLQSANVQKMDGIPVGVTLSYSLPLRELFQCIDKGSIPGLAWTAARQTGQPLLISGIQLSIEQGPQRPDNVMQVTYSVPRLVKK